MEVKSDILEKLRCDQCRDYLSCGPVTINTSGNSICGRCYDMDKQLQRNYAYEHLATLALFPCKYTDYGCIEKYTFQSVKSHEDNCKHKHYPCAVAKATGCDWKGRRNELIGHCKLSHSDKILPQPYVLEHDIQVDNERSFLIILYNVLFLLQTKVNLMAGKIYHSLQCFANEDAAAGFSYQLVVKNKKGRIIKDGVVLSSNVEELDESNSVVTKINGLFDIMSSYEGISFTIQLVRNRFSSVFCDSDTESESETNTVRVSLTSQQSEKTLRKEEDSYYLEPVYVEKKNMYTYIQICSKCKVNIAQPVYQTDTEQLCIRCAPRITFCKNRSKRCDYMDISKKTKKHCRYFCKYTTYCWLCQRDSYMSIKEHYLRDHNKMANGEEWLASSSAGWESYVVSYESVIFILEYFLSNNELQFNVRSSLKSKEMYLYSCELLVSNSMTKGSLKKTLKCQYELWRDWTTNFDKTELKLLLNNGQCEMNFYIIKKN